MKPDHYCANHPTYEALSFCHSCKDWLCSECMVPGRNYYYCKKPDCLLELKKEQASFAGRCPACGKPVDTGAAVCFSCGKKLRELTPEEKEETTLITIARFGSPTEAYLAKTKLESEDIESYVADEHMIAINPGYNIAFGGVRLKVKKSEAARALEVLGIETESKIKEVPQIPKDNHITISREDQVDSKEGIREFEKIDCPHCGEKNELMEGVKFCSACGKKLTDLSELILITCPGCGQKRLLNKKTKFCSSCGGIIGEFNDRKSD